MTTSGSGSQGLYAVGVVNGSGAASTISANGVAIATVGSPGIEATGVGAQVSTGALPGVGPTTVTTTDAVGVQADTGGAVTLNGGSVTTSGAGAVGVAATTGGRAALDGVTVTTSGEAAHALAVSGSGSQASVGGGRRLRDARRRRDRSLREPGRRDHILGDDKRDDHRRRLPRDRARRPWRQCGRRRLDGRPRLGDNQDRRAPTPSAFSPAMRTGAAPRARSPRAGF